MGCTIKRFFQSRGERCSIVIMNECCAMLYLPMFCILSRHELLYVGSSSLSLFNGRFTVVYRRRLGSSPYHSFHHTKFDLSNALFISFFSRYRTSPELSACMACKSHDSNTAAIFSLAIGQHPTGEYRLSRRSGSRIGLRGVVCPGKLTCPLPRRECGAGGNDMTRTVDLIGGRNRFKIPNKRHGYREGSHQLSEYMNVLAQRTAGEVVSQFLGWTYFGCWTVSFYPQVLLNSILAFTQILLNFQRKSVVGLSVDFVVLNVYLSFV
jgi:hypothetical protein